MRITQVELTNIKSYRHAVIALHPGTIAIRGRNGAGKSTLVEAIGFALFDTLPYKQAQFVREGERIGTVAVCFTSAYDEREYQVVRKCGNTTDWYAYDPQLGTRVAEQKADVTAFLRQHLRIEGEVALDALFNDAIGVPQGTFTQDFLLTPMLRKKKFDTLLQVEDYRKAAERLSDTRGYLQDAKREQQKRIDDFERETSQLATWRERQTQEQQRAADLTARLEQLEREATEIERRREHLRRQEAEVARLAAASQVAAERLVAAETRASETERRAQEAREAVRICQEARADYEAFGQAEQALAGARQRARERDALLQQRAESAQRLEGAKRDLSHAQQLLDEAREAERRMAALATSVKRQEELERERDQLQRDVDRLAEAERDQARLRQEITTAQRESADAERQIAALAALAAEDEKLPLRRAQLEHLQAAQAARAQQEQRHSALLGEEQEAAKKRKQLAERERKERENVRKLEDRRAEAQRLPALEAEHTAAEREVRSLETSIAHAQAARAQSGAGLCPFLKEPCLNIQRRGENNLGAYFDRLISADELKLAPARRRLDSLAADLEHVRTVHQYYARLPEYQERLRQAGEDLAHAETQLARLAEERAQIESVLAAGPTPEALAEARAQYEGSLAAERKRAVLPTLQEGYARTQQRLVAMQRELTELQQRIAALASASAKLHETTEALGQLGDPRQEAAGLRRIADERARRETDVKAAAGAVKALGAEVAHVDGALRPFVGLDEELRRLESTQQRTAPGHTRYLQHEQVARSLAEREQALTQARREHAVADAAHKAAVQAHITASATFDAQELARVSGRADELSAERGRLAEGLRHAQDAIGGLQQEITRVEGLLKELEAARAELARLDELERMLQQFRDTIKEAGPHILKAVLHRISVEANRIFGEILGDRSAQLSWEDDYEIKLRRDGRERSFAQLSGGEQMSAALAVRLALLRGLSRLDIAFFDEPTQNMDDERRGNLAEQIRRVRGFDQLIVISHDDTFEQGLDSVIHLDKRGGETVLVKDEVYAIA